MNLPQLRLDSKTSTTSMECTLQWKVEVLTVHCKLEKTFCDSMVRGLLFFVLATRSCSNTLTLIDFSCRTLDKWGVLFYSHHYFQFCFPSLVGWSQTLALRYGLISWTWHATILHSWDSSIHMTIVAATWKDLLLLVEDIDTCPARWVSISLSLHGIPLHSWVASINMTR